MKKAFYAAVLFIASMIPSAPNAQETTTLVYPTAAADTELDNSTPAKRITPPIREESEYDPVTPIGQIRAIVDTLNTLETQQNALIETVGKLRLDENKDVLPILERSSRNQDAIGTNVNALLDSTKGIAVKIDSLAKTTADLRATVESVQKTAASVERIRTSRWTDFAVIAILALVIVQIIWRVVSSLVGWVKARAERWHEMAAAYELAKQQLAAKETRSNE